MRRFFLGANLKLISFAAYNNDVDIRIKFQFFLSFDMNISRLRPTITPSSSHISFCSRLRSIVSLGDNAKMSSTRVSVPVRSIVFPFILSLRFFASNNIDPKVNIPVCRLSGKTVRGLPDLKKTNPTNVKNDRPPRRYPFFAAIIPVGLNLILIK